MMPFRSFWLIRCLHIYSSLEEAWSRWRYKCIVRSPAQSPLQSMQSVCSSMSPFQSIWASRRSRSQDLTLESQMHSCPCAMGPEHNPTKLFVLLVYEHPTSMLLRGPLHLRLRILQIFETRSQNPKAWPQRTSFAMDFIIFKRTFCSPRRSLSQMLR